MGLRNHAAVWRRDAWRRAGLYHQPFGMGLSKADARCRCLDGDLWTTCPWGAYRALCARCAKSWLFSTTGSSISSED